MADKVTAAFMERQFEEGMTLTKGSDMLELVPVSGKPPQTYIASYRARGLVRTDEGEVKEGNRCDVRIWLPDDYLRRAESVQVLSYLGPSRHPWHPNILPRPPYVICVHLSPGTPLVDLLYTCFELWTWTLYGTRDDGFNPAASQWARNQDQSRFPVDRRPLKRRALRFRVDLEERPGKP